MCRLQGSLSSPISVAKGLFLARDFWLDFHSQGSNFDWRGGVGMGDGGGG